MSTGLRREVRADVRHMPKVCPALTGRLQRASKSDFMS
ncbi:hypothetical protein ATORI0001_0158 [Lancefieldella rimae ATCC 49626]|uniref:Uncharacterized protein n=1 Tax=Lancefieldella rimae (strain ATCC 49626 / DSM 7090 / CCUG 31168 / NBRC 15546 / VPI D140H-11A) TaxID=553184 RepID=B9CNV8_LANR4|nr:hypothetical protein ATORI0001_0158 [Lancefieldella rimae ATCC 49626]